MKGNNRRLVANRYQKEIIRVISKAQFQQQYLTSLDRIAIATARAVSHPNCLDYLTWLPLPSRSERIPLRITSDFRGRHAKVSASALLLMAGAPFGFTLILLIQGVILQTMGEMVSRGRLVICIAGFRNSRPDDGSRWAKLGECGNDAIGHRLRLGSAARTCVAQHMI